MNKPKPHGLILAGMQSSSGKTSTTCMLLATLKKRGIPIQPFKTGPDFIDPGYHAFYAGISSRNLDAWMMSEAEMVREVQFAGHHRISIVEGVMGLFDGCDVKSDRGSSMALARLLDWPVVLAIPCAKAGRSLAAALRGFIDEAGPHRIAGVILCQVGGSSHANYLKEAIAHLNIPVLGVTLYREALRWKERHLGLQASSEIQLPSRDHLAQLGEEFLEIDKLLSLVTPAATCTEENRLENKFRKRIALARDEAFHFYYESNLDYLKRKGVELVEFSPLRDVELPPNIDGLILGGGFPEVFAQKLSENIGLRVHIRSTIESGLPCYAECGGLMYLTEGLITLDQKKHPMVGVIPGMVEMTRNLHHFGYCTVQTKKGVAFRGHEFHHSRWLKEETHANLWKSITQSSGCSRMEGFQKNALRASYVHILFSDSQPVVDELFGLL